MGCVSVFDSDSASEWDGWLLPVRSGVILRQSHVLVLGEGEKGKKSRVEE